MLLMAVWPLKLKKVQTKDRHTLHTKNVKMCFAFTLKGFLHTGSTLKVICAQVPKIMCSIKEWDFEKHTNAQLLVCSAYKIMFHLQMCTCGSVTAFLPKTPCLIINACSWVVLYDESWQQLRGRWRKGIFWHNNWGVCGSDDSLKAFCSLLALWVFVSIMQHFVSFKAKWSWLSVAFPKFALMDQNVCVECACLALDENIPVSSVVIVYN